MCFRLPCRRRSSVVSTRDAGAIFLQDNRTVCEAVKCREGDMVESIIKKVCHQLEIPPIARFFFALCNRESGVPMNPFKCLSKQECSTQYQLRIFVNVCNSWYLKIISPVAYDYYYQQTHDDFVNDHIQPHVSINSGVWMTAINMAKVAKEMGKKYEELQLDTEKHMPKFLYRRYQQDYKVQKKLKEVFDCFCELSVDGSHYINKFLEVFEKDSMCGCHMFPLKQSQMVSFLGQESQHVVVSWREGIYKVGIVGGTKDYEELLCSIVEISALTADFDLCQLAVSKSDQTKAYLTFMNIKELVGFCVIVQTYWWLKVDGSHIILNGDIAPPEESLGLGFGKTLNHNPFCYAPIAENTVEQVLQKHFTEGNFLIRESRMADDAFTLSVCHNRQVLNYRIVHSEDGTYSFWDLVKSEEEQQSRPRIHQKFPTLHTLLDNHKHKTDGLPTLLGQNVSPDVAGKVPLLPSWNPLNFVSLSDSNSNLHRSAIPTKPADSAVSMPNSQKFIMWTQPLTGMQCQFCQQQCGNEFVHLCGDCDYHYCMDCARSLPRRNLLCYVCQPVVQVRQRDSEGAQHDCSLKPKCKDAYCSEFRGDIK